MTRTIAVQSSWSSRTSLVVHTLSWKRRGWTVLDFLALPRYRQSAGGLLNALARRLVGGGADGEVTLAASSELPLRSVGTGCLHELRGTCLHP